ncbi:transporter substrate-binding domain-containing protein [Gammaproteobacteria bacterium AB-CW1]|uniref:Transporter substrate-binding domain-containing protein n=1 Tax=Natronospira elongata TaxID=3110268 RepID=A0AAP6MLW5_9GAMM|nr:transporter substrate-binding domain-containing protein [Gammaproteobacteria bacterium AB-CW1]
MNRTTMHGLAWCLLLLFLMACEAPDENGAVDDDAVAETPEATTDCELVMGWDPWEPYQYRTPTGEVAGLDVELVSAAAEKAGCELEYHQADFVSLLAALRDGEIDFIPGATRTAAREEFAYFSIPYRDETFAIWVRAEDLDLYQDESLESLLQQRRRVGLTEGFLYGDEAEAVIANPDYERYLTSARIGDINLLRLLEHDIDALIEDPFVAASVQRRLGLEDQVARLEQELSSGEVTLMFSRESVDQSLVERFDEALQALIEGNVRDEITTRYQTQ